ncbi:MAG: thioredoxin family protein [Acidimicrobiia bacterium]|nr:thioredoxin family protein [Acidimicrobiia bacterium]
MKLDEVNVAELNKVLLAEERGVILDFWGTWCQPCRTLRPHLEDLADDFSEAWRLVAIHVEENPDLVVRYGVMSTPTLVFIRGGEEIHRVTGAATPSAIAEAMATHA